MTLLISTMQTFCDSFGTLAWGEEVHIKSKTGHFPGLSALRWEVRRSSMTNKSAHWAGDFAMQRRTLLLMRAKNICRNASDAEDLVQETILRFMQAFESVMVSPDPRRCEAWMMRALQNLFYDQYRKRRVQEQGAKEPSLANEVVLPEPVGDPVYDEVTREQLAAALDKLSPKLRETFKLHLAGKKYHEIAELLGVHIGTVAKRLHDARAKLHELLKRGTRGPGDLS